MSNHGKTDNATIKALKSFGIDATGNAYIDSRMLENEVAAQEKIRYDAERKKKIANIEKEHGETLEKMKPGNKIIEVGGGAIVEILNVDVEKDKIKYKLVNRGDFKEFEWSLLDEILRFEEGYLTEYKPCPDCIVAAYPACSKHIPCCKCEEKDCNSHQPCPKKHHEAKEGGK